MGSKVKDISREISLDQKAIATGRTSRLKAGEKLNGKVDAKNRIIIYLTENSIDLNSDELAILQRWEHADLRMREKKLSLSQIADEIADKFQVSKWTAENDIIQTQEVFARSRKINKKYLGHIHLERVDKVIEAYREQLFKDNRTPTDKEIAAFSRLLDSYTYTLNSLPQTDEGKKAIAPVMVFGLIPGVAMPAPMEVPDALKAADEYIDHEEVRS